MSAPPKSGQDLALAAMKKEHRRLVAKANRAKAEADEYCSIGSELVAIYREIAEIVKSGSTDPGTLKKLKKLQAREKRALAISKKDAMTIFDAEHKAEAEARNLEDEIRMLELRRSRKP